MRRAARRRNVSIGAPVTFVLALVASASSCQPIEPKPLTTAPLNTCPCDKYEPSTPAAQCSSRDRCEISTVGRPQFPFWIVVHLPETSISAPGLTYVFYSDADGNPAFKDSGAIKRCRPPFCLSIGGVTTAEGRYRVSRLASATVGYPLAENTSIPMRVVYRPTGSEHQTSFPALPLDVLFASSQIGDATTSGPPDVVARRSVLSGQYRRIFYPEPPLDQFFPPKTVENLEVTAADPFRDDFFLGDTDVGSWAADVTRDDGLDGWRLWLVDRPSQGRISMVRTLSGTAATAVNLFTTGESLTDGRDRVDAVVAPPESWTAVPRFVTPLFSGAGLKLNYPRIPPPVTVSGVVAQPGDGGVLLGYAAVVSFESKLLTTTTDTSPLLSYSTTVNTDDHGRFATVLPPGTYFATVEPAEGTGYAKKTEEVVVDRLVTALKFQPPPRTIVKGRAVLTDGRPLSGADVIAIPNVHANAPTNPLAVSPRPARTHTGEDGRYALELDPGSYVLSVIPKEGTGFPRIVIRPDIPSSLTIRETELPEVRVPAPTRLGFTLRDSTRTENAITNAVVRVFAAPGAGTGTNLETVEIGSAMTDASGAVEILLAQQPP